MADLIVVPLKKSSDVDIIKPLKNLIQSTYNPAETNEDFSEAINELSRLRSYAIWKVFDKSSLDVLYSYYDQLLCLERKIPPQEVQIPFKWKDAFDKGSIFGGRMSLTVSSLAYERMCIMFNMAAMQSALAAQQTLDTEDSLKLAAKLLQQSAGIFSFLKANIMLVVHQEPTPDLSPDTLSILSQIMLAQAQEVIAYKCMKDEMKDSMVAKVCSQCEELYTDVVRALQRDTRQWFDRDWILTAQSKQSIFRGLANYHQAQVCRANKSFGEEIARLKVAVEALKAGREGSPAADAAARAARQLAAAERDNDFIYHERVPDARSLEPVARAAVASAPAPQERWAPGHRDLFEKLMPAAVHRAVQAAAARRAELVGAEIDALREDTQLLNSILASLDLPACVESAGAGLPDSTRARAVAVRAAGGLPALERLMAELPELLQRNREILTEAERMLREEAEADSALRVQFGSRWTRTDSDKLTEAFRANASKYAQIIDNAVRADSIVQQKYLQHREGIELLSRSDGEIGADVPDAPDAVSTDAEALRTLRGLMQSVEELKAERDAIEAELKSETVDVRERLASASAADFDADAARLSEDALSAALAPVRRRAAAARERQEQLAARLREAHDALMAARGGASGRERALTKLSSAADAYQDLTNNLKEGIKFYNDLTQLLVAFQNKVSDYCFARKTEKDELLKDLTQEASRSSPRPAPAPPQHHADAVSEVSARTNVGSRPSPFPILTGVLSFQPAAAAKREPPPRPPPPAAPAASLPYPQQPQGMPLPYGAAPAPYPVFAPMPTLYNPYATLPYPHHRPAAPSYQPYQYPPPPSAYPQPPPAGYNPYHQQ